MTKPKTESQKIKEEFVRLRDFNSMVFNYNSSRANNPGLKSHPDWQILTPKLNIVYIETKIGSDSLKPEQIVTGKRLSAIMGIPGSRVYYYLCRDSATAKKISDEILRGEL